MVLLYGGVVLGFWRCFGSFWSGMDNACILTKNSMCLPTYMGSGRGFSGGPVGDLSGCGWRGWKAGWLVL